MVIVSILVFHDLGHIAVLKILGYKIERIEILPFGGNIETNMGLNSASRDILLVSIAGVLAQIILYGIFYYLYMIGWMGDLFFNIFFKYNTILILFNLLPIYPLDGNKIFTSILECFWSFRCSLIISNVFALIFLGCFGYLNYIWELGSYPIIFFLLFKVISYIKEYKFIWNKFLVERALGQNRYKKIKNISSIKGIYKNKFNFINGISERKVLLKKFNK